MQLRLRPQHSQLVDKVASRGSTGIVLPQPTRPTSWLQPSLKCILYQWAPHVLSLKWGGISCIASKRGPEKRNRLSCSSFRFNHVLKRYHIHCTVISHSPRQNHIHSSTGWKTVLSSPVVDNTFLSPTPGVHLLFIHLLDIPFWNSYSADPAPLHILGTQPLNKSWPQGLNSIKLC